MTRTLFTVLLAMTVASCRPGAPDPDRVAAELAQAIDSLVAGVDIRAVSVSVRDAATGLRFDRDGDRLYHAASTMKVPVMIEIFRQVEAGRLDLADSLVVENRFRSIVDSSEFAIGDDSYDDLYGRLGGRAALGELVDAMITWSSNLATNLLMGLVTADSVQATSERLGTTGMRTLRGVEDLRAYEEGLNNVTTSADLAILLEALRDGRAVSPAADRQMVDVLLSQHFDEMIPAGLPGTARVAHKTGQITEIHHDAAIVYPETGEPYVLVVLVEGLLDAAQSAALGADIARVVHGLLRP